MIGLGGGSGMVPVLLNMLIRAKYVQNTSLLHWNSLIL